MTQTSHQTTMVYCFSRIAFLYLTLFLLSLTTVWSQNPPGQNIKRDTEVLQFLIQTIRDNYYDKNYRGIDLNAHFKKYLEKLKSSRSDQESLTILAAAAMEFDDSHTNFLPPSFQKVVNYDWQVAMVGDTPIVTNITPGGIAEKQGLKKGDVVLSLDGVPPNRQNLWKLNYYYHYLNPHQLRQLVVQSPGGKPRQITIEAAIRNKRPPSENEIVAYRKQSRQLQTALVWAISDEIGYWRIPQIEFYESSDIEQLLKKIKIYKKLILDLRANPGGDANITLSLISCLFEREIKAVETVSRKKTKAERIKPHEKGAFTGELIVLVDSETASGGEIIARIVQLEKRGIVIGDKTLGSVMLSEIFQNRYRMPVEISSVGFQYGIQVSIADVVMSDGQSIERVGITPNELLFPTSEDIAAKRDPVLARAITLLGPKMDATQAGRLQQEWAEKLKQLFSK